MRAGSGVGAPPCSGLGPAQFERPGALGGRTGGRVGELRTVRGTLPLLREHARGRRTTRPARPPRAAGRRCTRPPGPARTHVLHREAWRRRGVRLVTRGGASRSRVRCSGRTCGRSSTTGGWNSTTSGRSSTVRVVNSRSGAPRFRFGDDVRAVTGGFRPRRRGRWPRRSAGTGITARMPCSELADDAVRSDNSSAPKCRAM